MTSRLFGGDKGKSIQDSEMWGMTEMMTDTEHAVRNQQMIMLALGLTAAKTLARNRIIVLIGLAAVIVLAHRKTTAISSALRRRAAANVAAWRTSGPTT
jgi:hypothetical protein